MLRLQNRDQSARAATSIALEALEQLPLKFYLGEWMQTSKLYARYPDFESMMGLIAEGKGLSLCSKSSEGALRFYTTTVQDTIMERARLDPEGRLGLGTKFPRTKLHVADGDVFIEDVNSGIIMQSPDGTYHRIRVDNDGNLSSSPVVLE